MNHGASRMGPALALVMAMAVAAIGRPAVAAEPSPAGADEPSEARRASLVIDTSDIGEEGPVVKRRVRERTDVALRAAGVLPARPDTADPLIHVDVDALQGEEPGYQFELWVVRSGNPLGERRRVECTLCTESEIVARVEATVTEVLGQLDALIEEADAAAAAVEPTPATEPAPAAAPSSSDRDRRAPLTGLGKAGVGLISVGVVGVGVGAVLAALPPTVNEDDPLYETTTQPPGFVALGVGAAVLVSGVVMLVVDRKRARARSTARTTLGPAVGPHGAAVVWRGRF